VQDRAKWNLGQNVVFGAGQGKATEGFDRISLKNGKFQYDATKVHRKKNTLPYSRTPRGTVVHKR